jgi:hypothetical protein
MFTVDDFDRRVDDDKKLGRKYWAWCNWGMPTYEGNAVLEYDEVKLWIQKLRESKGSEHKFDSAGFEILACREDGSFYDRPY